MSELGDAFAEAHLDLSTLDADINQATGMLRQAVDRWERLLNLEGVVGLDTDAATAQIDTVVAQWQRTVDQVVAHLDVDTAAADAAVLNAAVDWEEIASVTGRVDLDVSDATGQIEAAAAAWESAAAVSGSVDLDTAAADATILAAAVDWEAVSQIAGSVDLNTDVTGEQLATARSDWDRIVGHIVGTVSIDPARATEELAAARAEWNRLVQGVTVNVDMDVTAATEKLAAAAAGWGQIGDVAATVTLNVDDADLAKLSVLASAFDGLKPLTNLPVRFHLDNESVAKTTLEIQAVAREWETSLNLTPTIRPTSTGPSPQRPTQGERLPLGDVNVTPHLDDTEIFPEATAMSQVLERILRPQVEPALNRAKALTDVETLAALWKDVLSNVEAQVKLDTKDTIPQAEALAPLLKEALRLDAKVGLDKPHAVASAEELQPLLERALALAVAVDLAPGGLTGQAEALRSELEQLTQFTAVGDLNDASLVEQASAVQSVLERILTLVATVGVDDKAAEEHVVALRALLQRVLGPAIDIPVNIDAPVAEAEVLSRSIRGMFGSITIGIDADVADDVLLKARALRQAVGENIRLVIDIASNAAVAKARSVRDLITRTVGRVELGIDFATQALSRKLEPVKALINRALGTVQVGVDFAADRAVAAARVARGQIAAAVGNVQVAADFVAARAWASARSVRAQIGALFTPVTVAVSLAAAQVLAEARSLRDLVQRTVGRVELAVDFAVSRAASGAGALRAAVERILGRVTMVVDIAADRAVAAAVAVKATVSRVLERTGITVFFDFVVAETLAKARVVKSAIDRVVGAVKVGVDFVVTPVIAKARVLKALIDRTMGRIALGVDFATQRAVAAAVGLRTVLKRVLGAIHIDVDLNTSKVTAAAAVMRGFLSRIFGDGDTRAKWLKESLGALAKVGAGALKVFGVVGVIAPLIASAVAALGGLIGTAAGFVTLGVAIGGAAAAAGVLGIALNKDLIAQVKSGLDELKTSVAAVTRSAGQDLIDKFQKPFVAALTTTAASAAKLTSTFIDPIANAALRWLDTFNKLLDTSAGKQFAAGLAAGISRLVDTFNEFLPVFLDIANAVGPGLFRALDAVIRMFLQLGVIGAPIFEQFFRFFELLAPMFVRLADTAFPAIEKLLSLLNDFIESEFFAKLVDFFGAAAQQVALFIEGFAQGFSQIDQSTDAWSTFLDNLLEILGTLVQMAPGIGQAFNAALTLINLVIGAIKFFGKAVREVVEFLLEAGGGIGLVLGYAARGIINLVGLVAKAIDAIAPGSGKSRFTKTLEEMNNAVAQWQENGVGAIESVTAGWDEFGVGADQVRAGLQHTSNAMDETRSAADKLIGSMNNQDGKWDDIVNQFKTTGEAYADFRAKMAEPVKLDITFPDAIDIAKDVNFTDAPKRKAATKDAAGNPLSDALIAADQARIDKADPQRVLSKSFTEAISDAVTEASDAVKAGDLARQFLAVGEDGLAQIVKGLTGEKLDQFVKEFGNAGSKAAKAAEAELDRLGKLRVDAAGGGFEGAIIKLEDSILLQKRKLEKLGQLDSDGFHGLAEQLKNVDDKDLKAALDSLDGVGNDILAKWEQTLDFIIAEGKRIGIEKDPLKKMFDSAISGTIKNGGNITDETLNAIGLSPDFAKAIQARSAAASGESTGAVPGLPTLAPNDPGNIARVIAATNAETQGTIKPGVTVVTDSFGNQWKYQGKARWVLSRRAVFEGPDASKLDGLVALGVEAQRQAGSAAASIAGTSAKRWKDLIDGVAKDASATEERILAVIALMKGATPGGSPAEAAATANAGAAGKAAGVTFNSGFTTETSNPTVIAAAATNVVTTYSTALQTAVDANKDLVTQAGGLMLTLFNVALTPKDDATANILVAFTAASIRIAAVDNDEFLANAGGLVMKSFAQGMVKAVTSDVAPVADLPVVTVTEAMQSAAIASISMLMNSGRLLARSVLEGVKDVGSKEVTAAGVDFMKQITDGLSKATTAAPKPGGLSNDDPKSGRQSAMSALTKNQDVSPAEKIGVAIGDGMIAGMNRKIPEIVKAAQAIAALIAATMKNALDVHSPSRVTMTIGEQVVEGLVAGMENGQSRAVAAAKVLADSVGSTISDGMSDSAAKAARTVAAIVPSSSFARQAGLGSVWSERPAQDSRSAADAVSTLTGPTSTLVLPPAVAQPMVIAQPTKVVVDSTASAAPASTAASTSYDVTIEHLEVTGVKDAKDVPAALTGGVGRELWRIAFGQSPRRKAP